MPKDHQHLSAEEKELMETLLKQRLMKHTPSNRAYDALYGKLVRENFRTAKAEQQSFFETIYESLHWMFRRFSTFTIAAVILIITTSLTSTLAYVSPEVNRDSNLYFFKRLMEDVELKLTWAPEDRTLKHLKFAQRRMDEVETLKREDKIDSQTLAEVVMHTNLATKEAQATQNQDTKSTLQSLVAKQSKEKRTALADLVDQVANETSKSAKSEKEISTLSKLEETIQEIGNAEIAAINQVDSASTMRAKDVSLFTDIQVRIDKLPVFMEKENQSVKVLLTNLGNKKTKPFSVDVSWGIDKRTHYIADGIGPQSTYTISDSFTFPSPGSYQITVIADPQERIGERTTANNRITKTITVEGIPKNTCPAKGNVRCDGQTVEQCDVWSSSPSLSWGEVETCGNGFECKNGTCTALPTCANTCTKEGVFSCNGANSTVCTRTSEGCLQYVQYQYCSNGCSNGQCGGASCGNSVIEIGEQCDDGNSQNNDGCSSSCKKEQCTDSDGGKQYDKKGTTTVGASQNTDGCYCSNGWAGGQPMLFACNEGPYLGEWFCDAEGRQSIEKPVECEYGCSYGTCKPKPKTELEPCTDSDHGSNIEKQGAMTYKNQTQWDYCNGNAVFEYSCGTDYNVSYPSGTCSHNGPGGCLRTCANGCSDGACRSAPSSLCGNSIKEGVEECDDGNTNNWDGCSSTCKNELAPDIQATEIWINRTPSYIQMKVKIKNVGTIPINTQGSVTLESVAPTAEYPNKYYSVNSLPINLAPGAGMDVLLTNYNIDASKGLSTVFKAVVNTVPGETNTSNNTKTQTLISAANPPQVVCGNEKVESGEECDDGNTISGDGCSAQCKKDNLVTDMAVTDITFERTSTTVKLFVMIKNVGQTTMNKQTIVSLSAPPNKEYPQLGYNSQSVLDIILAPGQTYKARELDYIIPATSDLSSLFTAKITPQATETTLSNNYLDKTISSSGETEQPTGCEGKTAKSDCLQDSTCYWNVQSATCSNAKTACSDSDPNDDPFTKGTAYGYQDGNPNSKTRDQHDDYCEGTVLHQGQCDNADQVYFTSISCDQCNNGVCITQ